MRRSFFRCAYVCIRDSAFLPYDITPLCAPNATLTFDIHFIYLFVILLLKLLLQLTATRLSALHQKAAYIGLDFRVQALNFFYTIFDFIWYSPKERCVCCCRLSSTYMCVLCIVVVCLSRFCPCCCCCCCCSADLPTFNLRCGSSVFVPICDTILEA